MGAVSLLLEICGSAPAITRAASCTGSVGARTNKPAQLAARSLSQIFKPKKQDGSQSIRTAKRIFYVTFCSLINERHPFLYAILMFKGRFL